MVRLLSGELILPAPDKVFSSLIMRCGTIVAHFFPIFPHFLKNLINVFTPFSKWQKLR